MIEAGRVFGYLTELTLTNVRCFAGPTKLSLCDPEGRLAKWTVLLGDNGVGKTTLLQCLFLAQTREGPFLWLDELPREQLRRLLREGSTTGHIELRSCHRPNLTDFDASPPQRGKIKAHLHIQGSNGTEHASYSTKVAAWVPILCCGYGASRKPASGSLRQDDQPRSPAATLFNDEELLESAEEMILRYDYASRADSEVSARQFFERVKDALIQLLPDVQGIRIGGLQSRSPQPVVEAETPYGWVRLRDLSLGYRTSMAWVIDLAAHLFAEYPDSANPLAEPAVCLVDEIDLHLHPRWQRKLIAYLDQRFPNTQFIVTAHSPLVVQAAEHANVAVLERHEGDDFVTVHNEPEIVRGWRIDQILTSELFGLDGARSPTVNSLLRARAKLLGKAVLDQADQIALAELDAQLEHLPEGESPEDQDAWDVVRRFAANLQRDKAAGE